ncbi:hypothetical protein SLS62_003652 [Diatrype stigma]|uniref:Protein kinase domain-containing protein n=1 Tax=Diatrype stigma TaxID=117547 RepID=A0AAN9US19_9PEZI
MAPIPSWPGSMNADTTFDHGGSVEKITTLKRRLHGCQLRNENGELFVPNGALEQILDEDTVRHAFMELPVFHGEPPDATERYASKVCAQEGPSRKILALLLLTDIPEAIKSFVDLGINDLVLPMPDPELDQSSKDLDSSNIRDEDDKWRSLFELWPEHCLRDIYITQWCLLAPSFKRDDSIAHYTFRHDHVLPFLQHDIETPDHSRPPQSLNELVIYGSHSQVRMVKIHPNHYDFGDYGVSQKSGLNLEATNQSPQISNPSHQFAVKKLRTYDYEDFAQEIEVFKRYWKSPIHIVPLLATYEIVESSADDPLRTYSLVFPWARGDLRVFWELNEELVQDRKIIPWIVRECYEITRALAHIHGAPDHPTTSAGLYGRHGDINPSNILWFPNSSKMVAGDLGKLVLADFGLTDFHRATSMTTSSTGSLPRAMTYRAPEFDTTKVISRAIDVWALGCTFLEFTTWFLKGAQAVREEFPEYRSELDIHGVNSDTFFQNQANTSHENVLLKPQVLRWIERLQKDKSCSIHLKGILEIIQQNMLVVDRPSRGTACEISQKLKRLHLQCLGDGDGYQASKVSDDDSRSIISGSSVPSRKGKGRNKGGRFGALLRNMVHRKPHDMSQE